MYKSIVIPTVFALLMGFALWCYVTGPFYDVSLMAKHEVSEAFVFGVQPNVMVFDKSVFDNFDGGRDNSSAEKNHRKLQRCYCSCNCKCSWRGCASCCFLTKNGTI
ncbi:hypothetical protein Salat_0962400 [Sesamum alatum]|uniref:Uncharacterized protein n=1 Tax=Sesamum alatum TaxID=300844 RepID=A0AAE2CRQ0_9LAMI|nr:hypothetical protein Salat_0962400 [Sesamum alatum]